MSFRFDLNWCRGSDSEIKPDLLQELCEWHDQVCFYVELVMRHVRRKNEMSMPRFVAVVKELLGLGKWNELIPLSMHDKHRSFDLLKHLSIVHTFSYEIGQE